MTQKQFEWLRAHQPLEVTYVEPYDRSKYPFCYHIISISFNEGYLKISGTCVKNDGWSKEQYTVKIHHRNIKTIRYINYTI